MNYDEVKKAFQDDTKDHKMEVLHDSGVYRHLKFTNNGSNIFRFDVVTYPGHLIISGDCGCFVFQRLTDMFEFNNWLSFGYVKEKCIAPDRNSGYEEFDFDVLKKSVNEYFDYWYDDICDEISPVVARQMRDDALMAISGVSNTHEAYETLMNLSIDGNLKNGEEVVFSIEDVSEIPVVDYSWRFIWCCYAIDYAVKEYKKHKEA